MVAQMTFSDLETLAGNLAAVYNERARRSGSGFQTYCPAHPDQNPSLSLNIGADGKLLWNCKGGCTQEQVLDELKKFLPQSSAYTNFSCNPCNVVTSKPKPLQAEAFEGFENYKNAETTLQDYKNAKTGEPLELVLEIPEDAPDPPARHYKHGLPSARYEYRHANGTTAFYIHRYELATGKEFSPLTLWRNKDGSLFWKFRGYGDAKPIYNLPQLANQPNATVVVCEGEKAAIAAAKIFQAPDYLSTAWSNGAQAVDKSDWSPLSLRRIILWADNDAPGRQAMSRVADILVKLNCSDIKEVRLKDSNLPKGFDAADAIEAGWTSENILQHASIEPVEFAETVAPIDESTGKNFQDGLPRNFSLSESEGLFFFDEENDKKIWICSFLQVAAAARDTNGASWGRLLEFTDMDKRLHRWCLPMSLLGGSGDEYRRLLLDLGLQIAPGQKARNLLTNFLQMSKPSRFVQCVKTTGWHRVDNDQHVFVTPNENIGAEDTKKQILFQAPDQQPIMLDTKGTLDEWKENVSALASGNSRLIFSLSATLAAPVLSLLDSDNFGVHIKGASSCGKTTALKVAASCWGAGSFVTTWRATSNGLEGKASQHNDLPYILDELGQSDPRDAGNVIYMLCNGVGKQRASRTGTAASARSFRSIILSSGENDIETHLKSGGISPMAGQLVRLFSIPADAGAGMGLFENLHGEKDGDTFARKLKASTAKYHGTAGRRLLEHLALNFEESTEVLKACKTKFIESLGLTSGTSSQVRRVAECFGLVASVGEFASDIGITGWHNGESFEAAKKCFESWLEERGGAEDYERTKLIAQVKLFLEANGESRFTLWNSRSAIESTESKTINRAGFKREEGNAVTFYMLPEVFKADVCKGFDLKFAKKVLADEKILKLVDGQLPPVTLPGFEKAVRVAQISSIIFAK